MSEKTILLVEDNDNHVFLTRRALAKLNIPCSLLVAQDGVEALDCLFGNNGHAQNKLPDLVLLDLKLPRVDGLQVLKQLRSTDKTRSLPVMVVTSSSEEKDIAATNQLGVTSYTVKSSNSREYSEVIQKLVLPYLVEP